MACPDRRRRGGHADGLRPRQLEYTAQKRTTRALDYDYPTLLRQNRASSTIDAPKHVRCKRTCHPPGTWDVDNPNGTLRLNHSANVEVTVTGGEFTSSDGTLQVDNDFIFHGGLVWEDKGIVHCDLMPKAEAFTVCDGVLCQ